MAKRKKKGKKRRGKKSYSNKNLMSMVIGGGVYGAGRQYASVKLMEVMQKTPLPEWFQKIFGNNADEALMLTASATLATGRVPLLKWKIPSMLQNKNLKEIGKAGVYIESAFIGSSIMKNGLKGSADSAESSTSGDIF
jgi:hypothetical protein